MTIRDPLPPAIEYTLLVEELRAERDEATRLAICRRLEAIKNKFGGKPPEIVWSR